jgi:hypothetical protein
MSKTFLISTIIFQDLCLILVHQAGADSDANIAYIQKAQDQHSHFLVNAKLNSSQLQQIKEENLPLLSSGLPLLVLCGSGLGLFASSYLIITSIGLVGSFALGY